MVLDFHFNGFGFKWIKPCQLHYSYCSVVLLHPKLFWHFYIYRFFYAMHRKKNYAPKKIKMTNNLRRRE